MGKLLGLGLAAALAAGTGYAGVEYGQRHPDLSDKSTNEVVHNTGEQAAKACGHLALTTAHDKYDEIKFPSTADDAAYNAAKTAQLEAQALVDTTFTTCMTDNFYGPAAGFVPEAPQFVKGDK